jgi:hypothetical protein
VSDFAESQVAYATRLAEDKQALKEMQDSIAQTIGTDGATPMDTGTASKAATETADAILAELLRTSPGAVAEDLPACPTTTEQGVVTGLAALWHFYASCGFADPPAVTFELLGIYPSFAHTLLADKVWNGFWGDRATSIAPSQHVPRAMHNMLKHIVNERATELKLLESAAAAKRHEAARDAMIARRHASADSPY